ncbi:MAG: class I SAM-dependent methyltransferase [Thermoguttaceae bacterium]
MSCPKEPDLLTGRDCAICGSDRKRVLFRQSFSGMSSGTLLQGYDVVVCADCGFGFADGIPEQASFDRYYREMCKYEFQHQGGHVSDAHAARFREMAASIRPFIAASDSRILDIGCGTAHLLAVLKEWGYNTVAGVTPSPVGAQTASELYAIEVAVGSLSEVNLPAASCDFVILTGVLEHIRDLKDAIEKIRYCLAADGRVFIEVPDTLGFADHTYAPFQEFSTEHINFFSPVSLANLIQKYGFLQVHSERVLRDSTAGAFDPGLCSVFQKSDGKMPVPVRDDDTEPRLLDYIRCSQSLGDTVCTALQHVVASSEPIIVWGVGTHTQRLLAIGGLDNACIKAFVDSNPRYQGKQINGIPIISPSQLKGRSEPVLISSQVFQNEIESQIRKELGLSNELIKLY